MAKKTTFMIAHGASVVVVRDGQRKTIQAGGGDDFTEDEINAVKRAQPGALRPPINEGRGRSKPVDEDADETEDEDGEDGEDGEAKVSAKTTGKVGKAKAPAKKTAADDDDI